MNEFISDLSTKISPDQEDNVLSDIWRQYERIVINSLITSFGLDFLVQDQHGGDVDTVRSVRDGCYKNRENAAAYAARSQYDARAYHSDPRYVSKVRTARSAYQSDGSQTSNLHHRWQMQ